MRTIIDIPDSQLPPLDTLCEQEGISRAEAIRQGIDLWLRAQNQEKKRKKVTLEDAFGLWKHRKDIGNGLEYQRKLRAEWDDRERAANEWRDYLKSHKVRVPRLKKSKKRK